MDCFDIETRIMTTAANALFSAGYLVRVFDGEEFVTAKSGDISAVMGASFTTDITTFFAYSGANCVGSVAFVHGNGCDVIMDNSTSLDEVLQPASDLADTLCESLME